MRQRAGKPFAGLVLWLALAWAQSGSAQLPKHEGFYRDSEGEIHARDDAAGFGEEGQWNFSTDAALAVERRTSRNTTTTTLSAFPAADYFFVKNLSLGGGVGVGYQKAGRDQALGFKVGPRVGYNFQLTTLLSFWPKVGVVYSYTRAEIGSPLASGEPSPLSEYNTGVAINLFAPLMLHPAPHFFAGFGPFLDTDLSGKNRATNWGFRLTLGGWL